VIDANAATTDGSVTFAGTVAADDSVANNRALNIDAGTGTVFLQSDVGFVVNTALADLDIAAGLIRLGGRLSISDVGAGLQTVTFSGPVQMEGPLNQAINAPGHNVTFLGTVNADNAATQNRALIVVATSGTIWVQSAIGNLQPLSDLLLNAFTGVVRLGGNITANDDGVSGTVNVIAPLIQLDANIVINTDGASADKNVLFQGAVNADDAASQDRTLTINAGVARAGVAGTIGNLQPLADLDVIAEVFAMTGNLTVNDGPVSTLTFSGVLGFSANAATVNTNGVNDHGLTVGDRLAGDAATFNTAIAIDAGTATVQLGAVGLGIIDNPDPQADTICTLADLDITAGLIRLLGNVQIDDQGGTTSTFNGPVELAADVSFDLDAAAGADNSIQFAGAINADSAATQDRKLVVVAGSGRSSSGRSAARSRWLIST